MAGPGRSVATKSRSSSSAKSLIKRSRRVWFSQLSAERSNGSKTTLSHPRYCHSLSSRLTRAMDFTNGFEEVDSPILAPRQSAFPPAQPTSTPSTKRRSAPSTASAILDLTDSPPPDPPQKKAKSSKHIETDSLEEWLADPVGLAAPHAKPTAGGAAAGAAPGSRDSASASTSGNRVETSALGEKERGEAGPFATGSSSSSSQPRARGAGTSAFVASSGSNGFAKYANPHSKPQQFLAYPYPSAAAIPAFASGSGSRPANSNGDTSSRSQSTSQQQHPPHQRQSAFASLKQLPQSQAPQSLGRIPIITSASAARVPSAQLASPSSSQSPVTPGLGKNYYRMQSASVSASISASTAAGGRPSSSRQSQFAEPGVDAKGKGREVIDLTADDGGSDGSDDVIVDDAPVCIGQLTSLALILYPVAELQPPPILDANGNLIPRANQHHLPQPLVPQPPLPVHIFRGDKQQGNETLKLISPTRKETFGVMEHRVANVVAPLFGDGWSGTGVTEGGRGKVWCVGALIS
jgi:SWI/SNF-related matrix-associated actin-dependent regulator of chromatin subfamily A3